MKVLVLDDDIRRHLKFKEWFSNIGSHHVYNYEQFCHRVSEEQFDVVFLDHDLGGVWIDYEDDVRELTGLDAAKYLAGLPHDLRPRCIFVHSWNTVGAERMMAVLKDAGYDVVRWKFNPDNRIEVKQ